MANRYNFNSRQDLVLWVSGLFVTFIATFLALFRWYLINNDSDVSNDYDDITGIVKIIIFVFIVALSINIKNTLSIIDNKNYERLKIRHRQNLEDVITHNFHVDVDPEFSIQIIENELLRNESWVRVLSTILITLGMVGTILGLTISMSGLSQAINAISSPEEATSVDSLGNALSGMSNAFITTLAGAILGGFFLKMLSHATTNLIDCRIDQLRFETISYTNTSNIEQKIDYKLTQAEKRFDSFLRISNQVQDTLHKNMQSNIKATKKINDFYQTLEYQLINRMEEINQTQGFKLTSIFNKNLDFSNTLIAIIATILLLNLIISIYAVFWG